MSVSQRVFIASRAWKCILNVKENLQYFQKIKNFLKLANFTTSYWSFGQYWDIYIFMRSVYKPFEIGEVAQLQKFFSLNLPKSICIQSSIMVISWNIDKNDFLSTIFDEISYFCQKVQKWAQKLQFWANWASSMNFWVLARLEMYVRA